jgi:hypothetical protein
MAAVVTVVMDTAAVDQFRGWTGPLGRSFERLAKETVYRQKITANRRTGALIAGMHYEKKRYATGIAFDAGSNAPYALYVDQGARPHPILPKKPGGRLVFFWPKVGAVVFLRSVKHPGNRAYQFLQAGLERALGVWNRAG